MTVAAASALAQSPPDALRQDIARAREKVYPALVNITVVTRYFSEGRSQRSPGAGSGVIVTPEGHVLTNYHVAGRSTRIDCVLPDGETMPATVVVHDPLTDLSVLKLQTDKRADPRKPLPFATLGDSDKLQIGDYVMALGNPLMLSSSLTLGVVSNPRRVFVSETRNDIEQMELDEGEATGLFTRWIQHDAEIAPGNSGGPLVNLQGEVVGINELRYGGGLGFAIPSNIAKEVLAKALDGGVIERAWLGVSFLPIEKLGIQEGVLISDVAPESAAEKAGVRPGDVLLKLNGVPVTARFFEEVPLVYQRVAALEIGKPAELTVLRDGKEQTLSAIPTVMEQVKGDEDEFRAVGATLEQVTRTRALLSKLPVTQGVRVTSTRPGYPFEAAQPPLQPDDIIVSLGGQPVPNLAAARELLASVPADGLAVVFRRRNEILVTRIKPREEKEPDVDTELPRPWLGVRTQVVTSDVASALGLSKAGGHRITEVYPGTEAAKAGLQPGDILVSINGRPVRATRMQDTEELKRTIEAMVVGESAKLGILRAGKPETITVALEATPKSASTAKTAKQEFLEFTVRDIVPMDRMESRQLRETRGVMVSDVTPGGWAAMAGLNPQDVVLSMQHKATPDVGTFESVMASILKEQPKVMTLFVQRGYRTHFVFIEPDWTKLNAASGPTSPQKGK